MNYPAALLRGSSLDVPSYRKDMINPHKKHRIYKEEAKDRHTTHWDMDYLPQKEVDDLYAHPREKTPLSSQKGSHDPGRMGVVLIIAGIAALMQFISKHISVGLLVDCHFPFLFGRFS